MPAYSNAEPTTICPADAKAIARRITVISDGIARQVLLVYGLILYFMGHTVAGMPRLVPNREPGHA